ncbi:MAG: LON peptidase substrate-binding domain-containing protein [Bacteroidetes bacterium]|nr:LON peptidase substrate-binding domain-containing protein [Bacteroidota bacterium]
MNSIGLFPLSIVLFPNTSLPLHIFEPRYRILLNSSIEKGTHFGINLVESSKMFEVGCSASVTKVTQRYPDGRFDVVIKGEKRYHLQNFSEGSSSYFVGSVVYFEDNSELINTELVKECKEKYRQIIEIAYPNRIEQLTSEMLLSVEFPSFIMAQKSGLSLLEKQKLLEMRSENARLEYLLEHLIDILPSILEQENIQRIIINDGYLPPPPTDIS